jgi:hypothetical protein
MFLTNIVRFGFPRREDSKVISAKKDFFQNITFIGKMKKVKAEILSQGKIRLHEHLHTIVFLHSSAKELVKNAFHALHKVLSF